MKLLLLNPTTLTRSTPLLLTLLTSAAVTTISANSIAATSSGTTSLLQHQTVAPQQQQQVPAAQRIFRLGKAAAQFKPQSPPSSSLRTYSTMSSATNTNSGANDVLASVGLMPQEGQFPGFESAPLLEPTPEAARLIKDSQDLFSAKPSPEIFSRSWSASATFADPICHANGSSQYLAQWYGMPAAFSESQTLAWKLTQQSPTEIQYVQKQHYKVKGLGMSKTMVSTVVMGLDNNGKITKFEDRWNHKPLGGAFSWPFRRLNAVSMPWLVKVPSETKQVMSPQNGQRKDL